ncbi:MAG: glycosyltransferase family 39 protein [Chitinophagales bacterium]
MEPYIGQTLIFFLFKLFFFSDIWASYFMVVALYVLNAFSVYKLAFHYTKDHRSSIIAGFFFAASCFMISTLELLNGLAFFAIPFSLLFLERFLEKAELKQLSYCVFFLALEFYFSGYLFLLGAIILFIRAAFDFRRFFKAQWTVYLIGIVLFLLLVMPLAIKLFSPIMQQAHNPVDDIPNGAQRFSLSWRSFISSLTYNPIYSSFQEWAHLTVKMDFKANLGLTCLLLIITTLFIKAGHKWFYWLILVIFLALSFGPTIHIHQKDYLLPLGYLYKSEIFYKFFRIPGRSFVICNFAIAILCAFAYSKLQYQFKRKNLLFVVLLFAFWIENFGLFVKSYDHRNVVQLPSEYAYFDSLKHVVNIAELPSSLFTESGYTNDGISEFNREFRYQYWQAKYHHQNIINGAASYFPNSRMKNNTVINSIQNEADLKNFIDVNQLDYVIYHHNLVILEKESKVVPLLDEATGVGKVVHTDEISIYKIKKN